MKTLIKNGKIVNSLNEFIEVEILIEDTLIQAIGKNLSGEFDTVIDAKGGLIAPGLVDLHVHLREPGFSAKGTIKSETAAAAHGGYTTICAMPNVNPVPDNAEKLSSIYDLINQDAVVHVYQYGAITENLRSDNVADMVNMQQAGAVAFTNDGVGVQTAGTMYQAMQVAKQLDMCIAAHAEDNSLLFGGVMHEGLTNKKLGIPGILSISESSQVVRDAYLAEAAGARYHVCHVSTKETVRAIRNAKQAGIKISGEVTPHHLLLTEEDIPGDDGMYKMNPPLRSVEDREALLEGLLDGTLDCIATDHAPHEMHLKAQGFQKAPFGIVGLESAFALIYTKLVKPGKISLYDALQKMSYLPAKLFKLQAGTLEIGAKADIAIFDLDTEFTLSSNYHKSLNQNTPFLNSKLFGKTICTLVDGKIVWQE